jgi:hypothetical protein
MDNDAVFWLVVAAIVFALDLVLGLVAEARIVRIRLVSAGLLAMAIAFIVERN